MKKNYSAAFKSRVALEAIRGEKTMAEIASQFEAHPNQATKWKKLALEAMPDIFADKRRKKKKDKENSDELYRQIGQLKVELDWLKKKIGFEP